MLLRSLGLLSLVGVATAGAGRTPLEADLGDAPLDTGRWVLSTAAAADADARLSLTVVLKRPAAGLAELAQAFWAVSTPGDPRYGKHLSSDAIRDLVAPEADATARVAAFFRATDPSTAVDVGAHGDLLAVRMTPGVAARTFATDVRQYTHADLADEVDPIWRAPNPYSLPDEVAPLVEMVGNLRHYPDLSSIRAKVGDEDKDAPDTTAARAEDNW